MTQTRRQLAVLVVGLLVAAGALFAIREHGQAEHDSKIDRMTQDFTGSQP